MSKKEKSGPKHRNIIHRHARLKTGAGPHNKTPGPHCKVCQDTGVLARDTAFTLVCPNCQAGED